MRFIILIITISISMASAQNIRENIFGFATSNTFTYCDASDTLFTNNVSRINPIVLRFPGGAVGNFYHYNGEGYGFDFNEIDKYHSGKFLTNQSYKILFHYLYYHSICIYKYHLL